MSVFSWTMPPPVESDSDLRERVLDSARERMQALHEQTQDVSTPEILLAAELLIAYRAVRDRMSLQELMDNLLRNVPAMYAIVLEAEAPHDLVAIDQKDKQ